MDTFEGLLDFLHIRTYYRYPHNYFCTKSNSINSFSFKIPSTFLKIDNFMFQKQIYSFFVGALELFFCYPWSIILLFLTRTVNFRDLHILLIKPMDFLFTFAGFDPLASYEGNPIIGKGWVWWCELVRPLQGPHMLSCVKHISIKNINRDLL